MKRYQARRGNGRFTRNTPENTFGLHVAVCPACRRFNPSAVDEPRPTRCHACSAELDPLVPPEIEAAVRAQERP